MTASVALHLDRFSAHVGERAIFRDVTFDVPHRGVVALMGPGGSGKSTLLNLVSRFAEHPGFSRSGTALMEGEPINAAHHAALVQQRADVAAESVLRGLAEYLPDRSELTQLEQRGAIAERIGDLACDLLLENIDVPSVDLPHHGRRMIALAGAYLTGVPAICVDEVTAELDDEGVEAVLLVVERIALSRGVLFVTHNQRHARRVADYAVLLAAGRMIEADLASKFFENPEHEATKTYIRTGGCSVPSVNANPDEIDAEFAHGVSPDARPPELDTPLATPPVTVPSPTPEDRSPRSATPSGRAPTAPPVPRAGRAAHAGPVGFHWLEPGRLAGTPYPGIVAEVGYDLDAIKRVGVTHLITLTETEANFGPEALERGLEVRFFPIDDMEAPTLDAAFEMCAEVEELIAAGFAAAYHCKAGLGRTGTMLAAQLVFRGVPAARALTAVREVHPKWVQSKSQESFLESFADFISERRITTERPNPTGGTTNVP